ncbi:MAG: chorismate mutase [Rhodospirillales bacterium]|nr:chorismate mutase [Rhodospirillales bacterium]
MTDKKKQLLAVREELDTIDNQIQDLLIRRTEVVEKVRTIKEGDAVKIRPNREAEMMYRLTARHSGNFPKRELCRIWREIIVATLAFEGPFSVAVKDIENEPGYWDIARDHFGTFTKMVRHSSGRAVVEAVRSQEASVGILPWPTRDDPDPWWRYMVSNSPDTPKIIARLPFIPGSNARGNGLDAAVICPIEQEPTGRDRSLLAVESDTEIGARRIEDALNAVGINSTFIQNWHDPNRPPGWIYLIEAFGFIDPAGKQFPRFIDSIGKSAQRIMHVGGYGTPLGDRDVATEKES